LTIRSCIAGRLSTSGRLSPRIAPGCGGGAAIVTTVSSPARGRGELVKTGS
jgi:hypothetical protein